MLEIKEVAIEGLKMSEYNPREMSKHDFENLKRSIQEFGMVQPVVVRKKNNQVIGGHQRLKALKELGWKKVPVIFVDFDEEKAKVLNLALNRISGTWDDTKLAELIHSLGQSATIDISLTGFSGKEVEELIEELEVTIPETFDLAKEVKKAQVQIKTRPGDLYQLGDNRLLCGDCTKKEDVLRLMAGLKADFCFTDPPYDLDYLRGKYKGGTVGFGYKTNRRYLTTETAPKFEEWLKNVHLVANRSFNIVVFENWKNTVRLWQALEERWKVKNMLIWHLTNRCQNFAGNAFFSKYDIALFASSQAKTELNINAEDEPLENEYLIALYAIGGGKPYFDTKAMKGKYFASDHIDFKASDATSSGQSIIFGTKPVEILIPYIKILSKRGDIVLEPFGGSGSTLIAAEKLKRRCFVMEKTPLYADVILARWKKYTGLEAVKINGKEAQQTQQQKKGKG